MPHNPRPKIKIDERRKKVAALYLRGYNQQTIADQFGVSQATISNDIKALLKTWREKRETDVEDAVTRQVEELRLIREKAWGQWRSTNDVRWLDTVMKAQDRESKLLGLDAPKRTDVTTNGENINEISLKAYQRFSPDDWDDGSDSKTAGPVRAN